jgi:hypothetical protein
MDIMEGEAKWMKGAKNKDGRQSHVQGRATPAELYKRLKQGGLKAWSDRFTAKVKPECGGLCVLECKQGVQGRLEPREPC